MKHILENREYLEDVRDVALSDYPWHRLQDAAILISGATGLIGSLLVDVIMHRNRHGMNCLVVALGRNQERAAERFKPYLGDRNFRFIAHDMNEPLAYDGLAGIDYIVHLASNTHPVAYATEPISTITTNIIGTKNLLDFAALHHARRFVFASSVEIYGENRGDVQQFTESYCGYIDSNTLRAGYPESKRCGEALCRAYAREKGLDVVIPRIPRSYGPTLLATDTKALSQFIHNGVRGESVVLKSPGMQYFSYLYAADTVSGLLKVMFDGFSGEAYNIADEASDIRLKDLAAIIADASETRVVFDLPSEVELAGFSAATTARLDGSKLQALGWRARFSIHDGLRRTIEILKDL